MSPLPSQERVAEFHREHPSPSNMGVVELVEALAILYEGKLDYRPHDIEHIESYCLMVDIGSSSAGFVMRLVSGRRVHLMCNIDQGEEDGEIEVDLISE